MATRHLVSLVTGVLILSVFVPILLSVWLANRQAHDDFIKELDSYTERVLMRTNMVTKQAKEALDQANAFTGVPCSRAHLRSMRQISYIHRYIQEVLWTEHAVPQCSSLERHSQEFTFPPPDHVTPDGYRAWLTQQNDLGLKRFMGAFGLGNYMVMIDPGSLIDVLPAGTNKIEVALIGIKGQRVIASTTPADMVIWQQMLKEKLPTLKNKNAIYNLREYPDLGLAILTWSSIKPLEVQWHHQLLVWVPIGILVSLLTCFFIVRLLRRLQSPHHRMLDAINANDISVHYQPIVSLSSGKIVGAEALARWQQPDGSWLSPEIFIPLAEQTGLITRLTERVIANVFQDLGKWLQQHPDFHVSINLSVEDLLSPSLATLLSNQLTHWQVAPSQIALELTERGFADPNKTLPVLTRYRKNGHAVYIDDFGTGYSSLSYLQDLDVDTLKIDKSFVDALEYKQVTPHIIEMAKSLKLAMVAEGVETTAQRDWLRAHGVQYGQGWLYSKALPKADFILWAEANLRTP
ncbi:YlaB family protein [Trabulsiella guamensis ATCC 49490]|uniref:cyclic-guanylate-specific phosphodiesterase n=1 Tax=Trabulsiella guamensis ATCC 49490 TaxID=1005994 RepID=A0A085AEW8_9ENTR|nr:EAL domain-containing protein [Trabulsiella guamensis]KFC08763.1 YlaB family protein [Trabulsiella guamensis ATCC 49490]